MKSASIAELGIDETGMFFVCPNPVPRVDYAFIYRAAMSVAWEDETGRLYCRDGKTKDYVREFKTICAAVADEYHNNLVLTENTQWNNVPRQARVAIEQWARRRAT